MVDLAHCVLTPHLLELYAEFCERFYDDGDEDVFDEPSHEKDERDEVKIAFRRFQAVDRSVEKDVRAEIQIS